MEEEDYDILCATPGCRRLIAKGYQIPVVVLGFSTAIIKIPPLDTLVVGNESVVHTFGFPMMETELLCIGCQTFVGSLYYHQHVLGTGENNDPDYLFRIGFDRVLYVLRIRVELSPDQFEDSLLEPLIGDSGLDEGQRHSHNLQKKRATHDQYDDL